MNFDGRFSLAVSGFHSSSIVRKILGYIALMPRTQCRFWKRKYWRSLQARHVHSEYVTFRWINMPATISTERGNLFKANNNKIKSLKLDVLVIECKNKFQTWRLDKRKSAFFGPFDWSKFRVIRPLNFQKRWERKLLPTR